MSNVETRHLQQLGVSKTTYRYTNPSHEILEVFSTPYYKTSLQLDQVIGVVSIDFPEFTSLCPVTGQPDFGRIVIEYVPNELCVESKSFKLYMMAYRNHQAFMEAMTAKMLDDFVYTLSPLWLRVCGIFNARGGTHLHAYCEYYRPQIHENVVKRVAEWKSTHQFSRTGGFNL